jgi:hypothetical protein
VRLSFQFLNPNLGTGGSRFRKSAEQAFELNLYCTFRMLSLFFLLESIVLALVEMHAVDNVDISGFIVTLFSGR